MKKVGISRIGAFAPEKKITNADLEKMVDTTDEWIVSRTGIQERRSAEGKYSTSDMAALAAKDCLKDSGIVPDLVIGSTGTNESVYPYMASTVSASLGLKSTFAFDVNAACSGLVTGIAIARSMLESSDRKNALVVASETMTKFTDYKDRASCILFGDGASGVLVSSENPEHVILDTILGTDPTGVQSVQMGGKDHFFKQDGKGVYKFAVTRIKEIIETFKSRFGIKDNGSFHVVPHQANFRMMEAVSRDMGIPADRFISNIQRYGNTSSASIGIALCEAEANKTFRKGDMVFLIGFGAGLSWAAAAIEW